MRKRNSRALTVVHGQSAKGKALVKRQENALANKEGGEHGPDPARLQRIGSNSLQQTPQRKPIPKPSAGSRQKFNHFSSNDSGRIYRYLAKCSMNATYVRQIPPHETIVFFGRELPARLVAAQCYQIFNNGKSPFDRGLPWGRPDENAPWDYNELVHQTNFEMSDMLYDAVERARDDLRSKRLLSVVAMAFVIALTSALAYNRTCRGAWVPSGTNYIDTCAGPGGPSLR